MNSELRRKLNLTGNGLVVITMRFPTSNQSALWWHPEYGQNKAIKAIKATRT